MRAETTNALTLGIWLTPWALWFVWELVLLWMRRPGSPTKPKTISMAALAVRYRLTSVVWTWAAMASHWFWAAPDFAPVGLGVLFWLVLLGLIGWDAVLWRKPLEGWPAWLKAARNPLLWMGLGFLAGRFLFPQKG